MSTTLRNNANGGRVRGWSLRFYSNSLMVDVSVHESLLIPMLTFASLVLAYRTIAAPYLHNNLPSSLVLLPSSFLTKHFTACAFHR